MKIELHYILKRNKTSLKTFIKKNKLTSYIRLIEYCETRNFIPCSEQEYNEIVNKVTKIQKEEVPDEREVSGKVSKAQKPKKRRYRRKKQQNTPKLSNSPNKG